MAAKKTLFFDGCDDTLQIGHHGGYRKLSAALAAYDLPHKFSAKLIRIDEKTMRA